MSAKGILKKYLVQPAKLQAKDRNVTSTSVSQKSQSTSYAKKSISFYKPSHATSTTKLSKLKRRQSKKLFASHNKTFFKHQRKAKIMKSKLNQTAQYIKLKMARKRKVQLGMSFGAKKQSLMFKKYNFSGKNKQKILKDLKSKFKINKNGGKGKFFELKKRLPEAKKKGVKGLKLLPVKAEEGAGRKGEEKLTGKPVLKNPYDIEDIFDDLMKEDANNFQE